MYGDSAKPPTLDMHLSFTLTDRRACCIWLSRSPFVRRSGTSKIFFMSKLKSNFSLCLDLYFRISYGVICISPSPMPRSLSSIALRRAGRRRKYSSVPEKPLFAVRVNSCTMRPSFRGNDVRDSSSAQHPVTLLKSAMPILSSNHFKKPLSTKLPPHWPPLPIVTSSTTVGSSSAIRYEMRSTVPPSIPHTTNTSPTVSSESWAVSRSDLIV